MPMSDGLQCADRLVVKGQGSRRASEASSYASLTPLETPCYDQVTETQIATANLLFATRSKLLLL